MLSLLREGSIPGWGTKIPQAMWHSLIIVVVVIIIIISRPNKDVCDPIQPLGHEFENLDLNSDWKKMFPLLARLYPCS